MDRKTKLEKLLQLKKTLSDAGLYVVSAERFDELAELSADAYREYPLHVWLGKGKYDAVASYLLMKATLMAMKKDAVVFADSDEPNE